MAQQRFEKGTELHQMMNDYLLMLQKYWVVEDTDDYWDDTLNAIYEFGKKYEQIDKVFAITMALAFVDVLEEKARQNKGYKGVLFRRLESDTNGESRQENT